VQFVYHMSVVAGFVVRGKLVYLKQACGDIWQGQAIDKGQQANAKAEVIAQQIEAKGEALNLFVRRGVFATS
jgi:hypothetical protein